MMSLPPLNRRHKAGLFLVLVAAGFSLFWEASAKQTAGVILLGLAATWFFGSVRLRTFGLIFASAASCVGLYMLAAPVWKDRVLYRTRVEAYEQAVSDIRTATAKIVIAPDQITAWDENGKPVQLKNWSTSLGQVLSDKAFLGASRDEQLGYLSYIGSDFSQASAQDQRAYLDYALALSRMTKAAQSPTEVRQPLKLDDLSKDQGFQGLSLTEKRKVLLAIGGDEIAFESPNTGKWKALPVRQWDEALNAGYHPLVPKKWFEENSPRSVQIPSSAISCIRPDKKGSEWDGYTISFPRKMTDEEILRAFQNNMLISRPTFSLRAAIRSHPLSSAAGVSLFLLGILGLILLIWPGFKRRPPETIISRSNA